MIMSDDDYKPGNELERQSTRIDELERELAAVKDNPEYDCTDAAHPAWWRGHEHTTAVFCQLVNEILDGKPDGGGIASQPWESTRQRLHELVAQLAALDEKIAELAGACRAALKNMIDQCDTSQLDMKVREMLTAALDALDSEGRG